MLNPVSGSTSPTKTIFSAVETNMTSVMDDDNQSVTSSVQLPRAPPPTGPNTVVGEKLPTADEIGQHLLYSSPIGITRSTPATSVVGPQDIPTITFGGVKSGGGGGSSSREQYPEQSIWLEVAEERLVDGLGRLVQYAKDMNTRDPTKTVGHYYSERLAKMLKEGAVEFDLNYMK